MISLMARGHASASIQIWNSGCVWATLYIESVPTVSAIGLEINRLGIARPTKFVSVVSSLKLALWIRLRGAKLERPLWGQPTSPFASHG